MYLWEKFFEIIFFLLFKGYFIDEVLYQGVIYLIVRVVFIINIYGFDFFFFKILLEYNVNKICDVVFGNISKRFICYGL